MKKIVLPLMLLLFVFNVFSQSKPVLSKDAYLLKSKKQQKVGFILLASGASLLTTGLVLPKGDYKGNNIYPPGDEYENDGVKAMFSLTGVAAMLSSIPFFVASGKNKRRAMNTTVSFNNQRILFPRQNSFVLTSQPTLTLRIGF